MLKVFETPDGNSSFPSIFVLGTSAKLNQSEMQTKLGLAIFPKAMQGMLATASKKTPTYLKLINPSNKKYVKNDFIVFR